MSDRSAYWKALNFLSRIGVENLQDVESGEVHPLSYYKSNITINSNLMQYCHPHPAAKYVFVYSAKDKIDYKIVLQDPTHTTTSNS